MHGSVEPPRIYYEYVDMRGTKSQNFINQQHIRLQHTATATPFAF